MVNLSNRGTVISLHEHELKPDVNVIEYERAVIDANNLEGEIMYKVDFAEKIDIDKTVNDWQLFIHNNPWQELVAGVNAKYNGCGIVYELPNFLNRAYESFAIVDMRTLPFSEPHYHPDGAIEIYFILQGNAHIIVGNNERFIHPGDVVIIPPLTAHFLIPDNEFVIAVVNTPPFQVEHYIVVNETNADVSFDFVQFRGLTSQVCQTKN